VVAGLLYNLDVPPMARPDGYGREAMAEVADRWTRLAEQTNRGRDADLLEELNVVVVLSEALSDPTIVPGVELAEDPIPFTRRLMASTTSGAMLSPQVGGGTANMEFEALTGLSLSQFQPQLTSPYPMLVADEPTFPSAVRLFEQLGKRPVAIHPFDPHMYKRDRVYPAFGFDEFVDESAMGSTARIGRTKYISDAAAFDEVADHLEESDEPLFVNLVTMQNHFPMAGKYDDPIEVSGVSGTTAEQLAGYARGLRHSDDALRDFVRGLRRSDEPTAVIVYGDHSPAFWARDPAFQDDRRLLRRTPFLLWSNVERLPAETLPLTSPVYFLPLLMDRVGVPVPPLYALLSRLHEEVPAMALGELHAADGAVTPRAGLGATARDLLADYRLVQYDLVAGEGYAEEQLLRPVSAAPEQSGEGG
jgi:phosphoglycerol transferase MdoB-like AlkP superfamily enzyme